MNVKIETKEKFHVITPDVPQMTANMAEELKVTTKSYLDKDPYNVILNLRGLINADPALGNVLQSLSANFAEAQKSFVVCCVSKTVINDLNQDEDEAELNIVPTESEAWDMVQMDEIERELLNGE